MGMMELFKTMLMVQLFFAFAITILTYSMPADSLNYVGSFSEVATDINLEDVSTDIQGNIAQQVNIPVVELGSLIFYSGNILIDLLLNFAFAIPEMIGLIVNGILLLFNVDNYLFAIVQIFASVVIITLYFVAVLQTLTEIRTGRAIN